MLREAIPKNAYTKKGQAVSGYRNLPEEVLTKEGWDTSVAEKVEIAKDKPIGAIEREDVIEELKARIATLEGKVLTEPVIKG